MPDSAERDLPDFDNPPVVETVLSAQLEGRVLRPSSAVFKHKELSVNIESLMIEQGRPPEDTLTGYPSDYLTSIIAGDVRAFGLRIVKDTAPPNDPAHGLVLGKKSDGFANAMIRSHQWIVSPPLEPKPTSRGVE